MKIRGSIFFGYNLNYIQIGHAYLDYEIGVRKADITIFMVSTDNTSGFIGLVNNPFNFTIHDAGVSTSSGIVLEQNSFVAPISTKMKLLPTEMEIYPNTLIYSMKVKTELLVHHYKNTYYQPYRS